ncbi:oxidoreductase [Talaromyces proteolyticus]|uniref:Oxidoreductase n=1 Tax=Talaromyces proteolyticus TaxID=1131652 RepID=A0AAD4KH16_9EURO|nr:oxidoreductase [Talaromyces proteolyticus]KAH8691969.1 oxidoreductase [Talaromyces proteolyticus]
MPPSNTAAWVTVPKAYPFTVKEAEYTPPSKGEVVVRVHAVALNPVDYARQELGNDLFSWTKYPAVFGSDVAGEIVEVGSGATSRFGVGDRIIGLALGLGSNRPADGAFQKYVILTEIAMAHIPPGLSYEQAAVIPLGLSTAASALFQNDLLDLALPTIPRRPENGKTVLIWSGASSVGVNAIQLAVAAGYDVISTASPRNFTLVKEMGASQVFDYNSRTIVADIVAAFKNKESVGAFAIGPTSSGPVFEIISQIQGKKTVILANGPPKDVPTGLEAKWVFGSSLLDTDVGPAIFGDYLPKALANGTFTAAPAAEIIGNGLESIQNGLNILKKGVSAKKLVVLL